MWVLMILTPLTGPPEISTWPSPIRCLEALDRQSQALASHGVTITYSECRVVYPYRRINIAGEVVSR